MKARRGPPLVARKEKLGVGETTERDIGVRNSNTNQVVIIWKQETEIFLALLLQKGGILLVGKWFDLSFDIAHNPEFIEGLTILSLSKERG